MKFRVLPVYSARDATENFEQLQILQTTLESKLSTVEAKLAAAEATITPGAWTALTLGTKVEEDAAEQTVRARTEGTIVRLRGATKIKAGETLTAGETLATLPVGLRPVEKRVVLSSVTNANKAQAMLVATTGVVTLLENLPAATVLVLDGLTFNLT